MADVKCGLSEINKNNIANSTHGLSPVKKMFPGRTEAMLDWKGPGPGPEPKITTAYKYVHATDTQSSTLQMLLVVPTEKSEIVLKTITDIITKLDGHQW